MRLVDSEIIPRRVVASERTESRETLVERSDPGPPAESELRKRSRYPTSPTVKTEVTVPAAKSKLADNSSRGMRKTRHSGTRGSPDAASDTDLWVAAGGVSILDLS